MRIWTIGLTTCLVLSAPSLSPAGEMLAGVEDAFAPEPDQAFPSPELTALLEEFNPPQDFDLTVGVNDGFQNRPVAHTFVGLPAGIVEATLELTVLGGKNNGVVNDGIFLSMADSTQTDFFEALLYRRSFGPVSAIPPSYPVDDPGLVGEWDRDQVATITLDLTALPLPDGGTRSLVAEMSDTGRLDVTVSDETAVDYMLLTFFVGTTGVESLAGGSFDARLVAAPNPFRSSTTIRFATPASGRASVRIFDVTGRVIRTLASPGTSAGDHSLVWDGRDESGADVQAGVYFYRLETDTFTETNRLVRIR